MVPARLPFYGQGAAAQKFPVEFHAGREFMYGNFYQHMQAQLNETWTGPTTHFWTNICPKKTNESLK